MDESDRWRALSRRVIIFNAPVRRTMLWGPGTMSDFDVGFVIFSGITTRFYRPVQSIEPSFYAPSVSVRRNAGARDPRYSTTLQPEPSDRGSSILPTCAIEASPSRTMASSPSVTNKSSSASPIQSSRTAARGPISSAPGAAEGPKSFGSSTMHHAAGSASKSSACATARPTASAGPSV